MDEEIVQVKALVPSGLKRQAYSVLALRGQPFACWLRERMRELAAANSVADARYEAEQEVAHD